MRGDDVLFFRKWAPGEIAAGKEKTYTVGPFSMEVDLLGICRDPGSDAGSANMTCDVSRNVEGKDLYHLQGIPSDSILFEADLAGGRVAPRINIPKGESLLFICKASAATTVRWLFLFGAPEASRQSVLEYVRAGIQVKA